MNRPFTQKDLTKPISRAQELLDVREVQGVRYEEGRARLENQMAWAKDGGHLPDEAPRSRTPYFTENSPWDGIERRKTPRSNGGKS